MKIDSLHHTMFPNDNKFALNCNLKGICVNVYVCVSVWPVCALPLRNANKF